MSAREEMAARVVELRAAGLTWREIGERVGLAPSTVQEYGTDPDGSKVRARKARSDGTCRDCGGRTIGDGGRAPERCRPCNDARTREQSRRWILDSFAEWTDMFGVPPTAADWNPAQAKANGMAHRARRHEQTGRAWPSVPLVQDTFGSWNHGRAAAGFDTFEAAARPAFHDPTVVAQTIALYRSGLTLAVVGERMGVTGAAVRQRLVVAGEPRRPKGRPKANEREASPVCNGCGAVLREAPPDGFCGWCEELAAT